PVPNVRHSFPLFLNFPAPPACCTPSLHDALPICPPVVRRSPRGSDRRLPAAPGGPRLPAPGPRPARAGQLLLRPGHPGPLPHPPDRKSTRLNSSHVSISYAVFCLKKEIVNNATHL